MARPSQGIRINAVKLTVSIPQDTDAAYDTLADATGEAKASHVRRALAAYLAGWDLADPLADTPITKPN